MCENAGDIAETREFAAEGSDAVVVGCDGVAALLCFADCAPVIIVAPSGKFAVAHCGWRGVVYGAWATALSTLCELTGDDPERFNVYIGPYIHACHFEVGEEVKINDGPFVSLTGRIDEIDPERGKLKVSVSIFGRFTPVELEYWQVARVEESGK